MNLSRRSFLRTNGGTLLLPLLPSLAWADGTSANVGKPSKKMVIVYLPNGIVRRSFFPGEENAEVPDFIGNFEADKTKNERRFQHKPGFYRTDRHDATAGGSRE